MKKKIMSLMAVAIVLLMLVFTSSCFAEKDVKETTKTGIIGAMDEEVILSSVGGLCCEMEGAAITRYVVAHQ